MGIHICPSADWGLPQPLLADEQSDTHVKYATAPHSVRRRHCSLHAHNGIRFSHTVASILHRLWQAIECGSFNQPFDKASCDAFHYVVDFYLAIFYHSLKSNCKVKQKKSKRQHFADIFYKKNAVLANTT